MTKNNTKQNRFVLFFVIAPIKSIELKVIRCVINTSIPNLTSFISVLNLLLFINSHTYNHTTLVS